MANQANPIDSRIHEMIVERLTPVVQELTRLDESIEETVKRVAEQLDHGGGKRIKLDVRPLKGEKRIKLDDVHPAVRLALSAIKGLPEKSRNICIWGEKGAGKTHACLEPIKAAMGEDCNVYSQGSAASKYDFVGYKLPSGEDVIPAFVQAWTHGGLWIGDEIDGSDPKALLAINAALANGYLDLSHMGKGLVPRHPDCIVLVTANTNMLGATGQYSARMRQDGAFRDRFVFIEMNTDEALERQITPCPEWTQRVQKIRAWVKTQPAKIQDSLEPSMRASFSGAGLLAAGLSQEEVESMVILKGVGEDVERLLHKNCGKPSQRSKVINFE